MGTAGEWERGATRISSWSKRTWNKNNVLASFTQNDSFDTENFAKIEYICVKTEE